VVSVVFALTATRLSAVVPLTILLGVASYLTNPPVSARVYSLLGETRTLGGAAQIAAINVGIALAPVVSGLPLDHGYGLTAAAWVNAAFAVAAVGTTLLDRHLTGRHRAAAPGTGHTAEATSRSGAPVSG